MTTEITISLEEELVASAMRRARAEDTTIDDLLRRWLADYAQNQEVLQAFDALTQDLSGKVRIGRKPTREEMNAR
ncbi:hypothetical protein [uncultured Thiodictyon sp.]|jgi:hypothetical protein|uniref:hypothetical protein n=1 Tax=uncultured Thiodictyon sp. TaxID=1846217 RepID=UPI0025D89B9E|nr:hypothetical protein [uncultured Thiodictyon sp.]